MQDPQRLDYRRKPRLHQRGGARQVRGSVDHQGRPNLQEFRHTKANRECRHSGMDSADATCRSDRSEDRTIPALEEGWHQDPHNTASSNCLSM